ncbi:hypothetical protein JFU49_10405 [Pseudomonas sp. TH03]|uniref:hypothetical protein n=1 Tax=Pseudomonas sp. TH03 TaxID=2796369 RepID=UPI0019139FC5|nr:hypothetical protein [Pseudomonas sp. TH03]MBK5550676.1 hypothetical protein [Pseudomonas sp. TH03]
MIGAQTSRLKHQFYRYQHRVETGDGHGSEQPDLAGHGEHLALVGDFLSFNEITTTLNRRGNTLSFKQVPREVFADASPLAEGLAATFAYFEAHTYLGSDSRDAIALANKVAGQEPTKFAAWAKANFKIPAIS